MFVEKQYDIAVLEDARINKTSFMNYYAQFIELMNLYQSAADEVVTKLQILDNEFSAKYQRNPIHTLKSRIKSPESILGKLNRKGIPLSAEAVKANLYDIAGVRVICQYIDDIYTLAGLLAAHDDIELLKTKDYIKNPKPNGYRSLHIVVNVPVFLSTGKEYAPVEIQIRTMAMDFWASLEHELHYKTGKKVSRELSDELFRCAETIADTDRRMQDIYKKLNEPDDN
ncbi:MAG: GTP pyrophosphokinase family protein [Oscillospiraceae bacterium]|nr:GTP pyrophosphokinase family protein [Oscillospiraceae bacterium]